jgi:hypothetical protein
MILAGWSATLPLRARSADDGCGLAVERPEPRKSGQSCVPRCSVSAGDYASTENFSLPDASFSLLILEHMESTRLSRENLNLIMDNIIQNIMLRSKTEDGHGG